MPALVPKPESLAQLIFFVRRERVMLDSHLAQLYGVQVRALNQAATRNRDRFPEDFMFQLTAAEYEAIRIHLTFGPAGQDSHSSQPVTSSRTGASLRSQFVISNRRGGRRYLPYAFTEQGVAMLSSVLRSPRAVEVNIAIMRTFVQLRRLMDSNRELARKIEAMEKKYHEQFAVVFDAIKQLIAEDEARKTQPKRRIGF